MPCELVYKDRERQWIPDLPLQLLLLASDPGQEAVEGQQASPILSVEETLTWDLAGIRNEP
jgi:hypothetical protein